MTNPDLFEDDVFKEKSLLDVFLASREIAPSAFNVLAIRISVVLAFCYVAVNAALGVNNEIIVSAIQRLSAGIVTATTAILGFLIAGFSIFVSATPIPVFRMLIMTRYERTNISYFKQILFNFLNVFTIYLFGMAVALSVNTVCPLGSLPIIELAVTYSAVTTFNSAVLAALSILTVYLVLRLKSFIWNMYQGLLINIDLAQP
jgi:hypothetical protein